jgi:hypothetical protein
MSFLNISASLSLFINAKLYRLLLSSGAVVFDESIAVHSFRF